MSILDRFLGLLMAVAYGLQRAKVGFLRLRAGVIVLCSVYAAYSVYEGWRTGKVLAHGVSITLCLALGAALVWADQRHYIVFRERSSLPTTGAPDLHAEEKLCLRGSGMFEVSNMVRYLVDVPVVFWTTQLADHVVAAQVRAWNLLGFGIPPEERGWWYVFIEPKHIKEIVAGDLYFGFGWRPAVRVQCDTLRTQRAIYLSCDSMAQRATLLKELQARAQTAHQGTS